MEKRFKNKCWDFSVVENGVSAKQSSLAKLKIVHILLDGILRMLGIFANLTNDISLFLLFSLQLIGRNNGSLPPGVHSLRADKG